ncbi:competence protein ComK [Bacillus aerolatus]|uniref:Competence protein ComK n=1 Tax=Bacillus aerolatus TaxID=2653354 RepID=A0A6I1FPN6_9BACI|nr:competence protein ComK [Bacillus aerolatus]KAB7706250.1 competence protein ComK [Bacillus aerolatus]
MFDERIALKVRLEQLANSEFRIIQEFQKEREAIFRRLKELDAIDAGKAESSKEIVSMTKIGGLPQERKRRGRRSENLEELRKMAVSILKVQNTPIRGVELQRQIEGETGKKIANMTTFMVGLERENHRVRKLGRGLYIYEYED